MPKYTPWANTCPDNRKLPVPRHLLNRNILRRAARPDRTALIAETKRIRDMTPGPLEDSVSLLREDRDSR